jgi:hypothetical protein
MNSPQKNFITYETEGMLHLSIGENFNYSPTSLVAYLRKNKHIRILSKKSWFLTDDYQSEFSYKDELFVLYTPLDSVDISPLNKTITTTLAAELYEEIKQYKSVSILDVLKTWVWLFFLPSNFQE